MASSVNPEVSQRCFAVIAGFISEEADLEKIKQGASILDTGTMDSLSVVNLMIELETEFGVAIDADDLEDLFSSLDKLSEYIQGQLN